MTPEYNSQFGGQMRPFILVGDKTDHGGVVISGAPSADVNGRCIARAGDKVTCPKKGHGENQIVEGDPMMIIDGRPVALHGHRTACGAVLISSQKNSGFNDVFIQQGHVSKHAATEMVETTIAAAAIAGVTESEPNTASATAGREPSGATWASRFPTSTSTADLIPAFRASVDAFVQALRNAGANVRINATLRPPERAYLMHWSWRIARESLDPRQVPSMNGVDVEWAHNNLQGGYDERLSRTAAEDMVNAYDIQYRPSLTSRHTEGRAVDMTITWTGNLSVVDANGAVRNIETTPRNGNNSDLWRAGRSFGVIKLPGDPPHWSEDGR